VSLTEADARDRRKVLIFSYYADTVRWISNHLAAVTENDARLADYRGRLTSITGTEGGKDEVLWGFAPRTTDPPPAHAADRYDIVVTTDVLAEGVNLQQARHIINYDLPWNPMRLVQRHGRIDRIGSRHSEVFLRCVFPDQRLDDLLGLEQRLERKLKQAAATVGVGQVLPGSAEAEITFTETRDEIERLRHEDATLFVRGGTASQRSRRFFHDRGGKRPYLVVIHHDHGKWALALGGGRGGCRTAGAGRRAHSGVNRGTAFRITF
jgi:hypothetical protein